MDDLSRSRAILIGAGTFQDPGFPPLPAVANSLTGMHQVLTDPDLCGWPADRVTVLRDPADVRRLVRTLRELAAETTGVLLLYFAGHGVILRRGRLCLVLADTEAGHADITGLDYRWIREALLDSPARLKLVVLDCCYAGRAIEAQSGASEAAADSADTQGVFTLTASDHTAHVVPFERQATTTTSFTGELLDLVRTGVPGGPDPLTIGALYPHLRQRLQQRGLPLPNRRGTDTADDFPFTRNAAGRAVHKPSRPPVHTPLRRPARRAIAIDLGDTNAVVAVLVDGEPTVIPNAEGSTTTPCVVAFPENAEILVGEAAKRQAISNRVHVAQRLRRDMGLHWQPSIRGTDYPVHRITGLVLRKLKRDAEAHLRETVTSAVITIPAYYSERQRQATEEAARLAGLTVLDLIEEPTAAVLGCGLIRQARATILVLDLGGSSFEISLLTVKNGVVDRVETDSHFRRGGDAWDEAIAEWLVTRFQDTYGVSLGGDRKAEQRIYDAAEKAKIELSFRERTAIDIPHITTVPHVLHLDESLTRAELNEITSDPLEEVENAIAWMWNSSMERIDQAALVGGSARIPAVVEYLTELTGAKLRTFPEPDRVVALGAARHLGALT